MVLMIRSVALPLKYANPGKLLKLKAFFQEYHKAVNAYIDILWKLQRFKGSFVERSIIDKVISTMGFTAKQSAVQAALHIVKSQVKKKVKTKPVFLKQSYILDTRFIQIKASKNTFDLWIRFKCCGFRKPLELPTNQHVHFNKYVSEGWTLKQAGRVRLKEDGSMLLGVYFQKPSPAIKQSGLTLGLDCGYKKLAVLSSGQIIGSELERKIGKISRKTQGSKAFKRALTERNDYINQEIKSIPFNGLQVLVVENLKGVKHKSKGKIGTKFMSKLQRWVYSRFLTRLGQQCETSGVRVCKVNPAYTSQRCNKCGDVRRENRQGELFRCGVCGHEADADLNASRNILERFYPQEFTDPVNKLGALVKFNTLPSA